MNATAPVSGAAAMPVGAMDHMRITAADLGTDLALIYLAARFSRPTRGEAAAAMLRAPGAAPRTRTVPTRALGAYFLARGVQAALAPQTAAASLHAIAAALLGAAPAGPAPVAIPGQAAPLIPPGVRVGPLVTWQILRAADAALCARLAPATYSMVIAAVMGVAFGMFYLHTQAAPLVRAGVRRPHDMVNIGLGVGLAGAMFWHQVMLPR